MDSAARQPEPVEPDHSTISGIPYQPLYSPASASIDYGRDLGDPGTYPFTRGVYETMYRGKLWTMRQFAGFGSAQETNERFRYLLGHGQTGLSTAFDMPTLMGYDSDHTRSLGEVGREGVAIDTLADMEELFAGKTPEEWRALYAGAYDWGSDVGREIIDECLSMRGIQMPAI